MAVRPHVATELGPSRVRPVLSAAYAACAALGTSSPERVWNLTDEEVTSALGALGALSASVDAHLVAVLAEAKRRKLGTGDGWGPVDWARATAPGLDTRKLLDVDTVAEGAAREELRLAELVQAVLDAADPHLKAVAEDALPVGKAAQIMRFHKAVRGLADATDLEGATTILLESARGTGGLVDKELATLIRHTGNLLRPDRLVEHDNDLKRAHRSLVKSTGPCGMSRYTMFLDDEGAAILDAAVDALAKPTPDPQTGERDPRSGATRRADALVELVQRAVSAPDGLPRQAKTSLVLTIGLDVLQGACRGAGLTMAGQVLTTDTVRRLACDAQVIPVVLGSKGEVLDQGMAVRLFDRAQIRHLWMRDRHCTFPGCSKPAAWTDAHHLIHWADDGPTDVWNAALLCQGHHTLVHRERYAGRVVDGPHGPKVRWDLTPGSYDRALAAWKAAGRPALTPATCPSGGGSVTSAMSARSAMGAGSGGGVGGSGGPPRP